MELDPVVGGIGRGLAQGTEQGGVEVGHAGIRVVEDRHAATDATWLADGSARLVEIDADGGRPGADGRPRVALRRSTA